MRREHSEFNILQNISNHSKHKVIQSFLHAATTHNLPIAVWKLPQKINFNLIIDLSGKPSKVKANLEELGKGFMFSPFLKSSKEDNLFIKADLHYTSHDQNISIANLNPSFSEEKMEKFLSSMEESLEKIEHKKTSYFSNRNDAPSSSEKSDFLKLINEAISQINHGSFEKVVVSRLKKAELKESFDLARTFLNLSDTYKNAFVSLVSIPETGTWIGASPETLIKVDANQTFLTESLAGTQLFQENQIFSEISWTQKEIEEQALVSRYIINCFKSIRLREFEEIGPKTIIAGNLMHLRTQYKVDMNATGFPNLGTTMLELLHPTSAVCGLPQKPALEFILAHEKYDRSFYSGFLGPVNVDQETHLFVNLRCMQLFKTFALLYAGAGILENSIPEKEWRETEIKCETLLNIIE
jgi:isochorismate synthase